MGFDILDDVELDALAVIATAFTVVHNNGASFVQKNGETIDDFGGEGREERANAQMEKLRRFEMRRFIREYRVRVGDPASPLAAQEEQIFFYRTLPAEGTIARFTMIVGRTALTAELEPIINRGNYEVELYSGGKRLKVVSKEYWKIIGFE